MIKRFTGLWSVSSSKHDLLKEAYRRLRDKRGTAVQIRDSYVEVAREFGYPIPKTIASIDASIRCTQERHSSDSNCFQYGKPDTFEQFENGLWGLRDKSRKEKYSTDKYVDATEELPFVLYERYFLEGNPRDPEWCAVALALRAQKKVKAIRVYRNIVKVLFADSDVWIRYQSTPKIRKTIITFDRETLQHFHKLGVLTFPSEGIPVVLKVPRKAISLEYQRGEGFKAKRKESFERRKDQPKRPHSIPDPKTLEGIRHGARFSRY